MIPYIFPKHLCKDGKIFNFSSKIIFGQILQKFGDLFLVTLKVSLPMKIMFYTRNNNTAVIFFLQQEPPLKFNILIIGSSKSIQSVPRGTLILSKMFQFPPLLANVILSIETCALCLSSSCCCSGSSSKARALKIISFLHDVG